MLSAMSTSLRMAFLGLALTVWGCTSSDSGSTVTLVTPVTPVTPTPTITPGPHRRRADRRHSGVWHAGPDRAGIHGVG